MEQTKTYLMYRPLQPIVYQFEPFFSVVDVSPSLIDSHSLSARVCAPERNASRVLVLNVLSRDSAA